MLQAWFPKEAEIWNQPTWFLFLRLDLHVKNPRFVSRKNQMYTQGLTVCFDELPAQNMEILVQHAARSALTFSNLTMPTFVLPQVAHPGTVYVILV